MSVSARAAGTKVWEVRTTAELAEGKLDGAIVTARGEIRTGWLLEKTKVEADAVWCLLPDGQGGTLIGTGNKGELFRLVPAVVPAEEGAKPPGGPQALRVAETKALAITVLRPGPDGGVLVGTAPEGRIFIFKDGKLTEFAKLEAKYVWDLAVAPDGTVYAATGGLMQEEEKGKEKEEKEEKKKAGSGDAAGSGLYRISDGKAELWFKSKEPNLIALALGDNDVVYAGSGEKGLLFRVTGKDAASVVYDFNENEVRAIIVRRLVGETGLVIACNAAKSKGGASSAPAGGSGEAEAPGKDKKSPAPAMPSKEPMD